MGSIAGLRELLNGTGTEQTPAAETDKDKEKKEASPASSTPPGRVNKPAVPKPVQSSPSSAPVPVRAEPKPTTQPRGKLAGTPVSTAASGPVPAPVVQAAPAPKSAVQPTPAPVVLAPVAPTPIVYNKPFTPAPEYEGPTAYERVLERNEGSDFQRMLKDAAALRKSRQARVDDRAKRLGYYDYNLERQLKQEDIKALADEYANGDMSAFLEDTAARFPSKAGQVRSDLSHALGAKEVEDIPLPSRITEGVGVLMTPLSLPFGGGIEFDRTPQSSPDDYTPYAERKRAEAIKFAMTGHDRTGVLDTEFVRLPWHNVGSTSGSSPSSVRPTSTGEAQFAASHIIGALSADEDLSKLISAEKENGDWSTAQQKIAPKLLPRVKEKYPKLDIDSQQRMANMAALKYLAALRTNGVWDGPIFVRNADDDGGVDTKGRVYVPFMNDAEVVGVNDKGMIVLRQPNPAGGLIGGALNTTTAAVIGAARAFKDATKEVDQEAADSAAYEKWLSAPADSGAAYPDFRADAPREPKSVTNAMKSAFAEQAGVTTEAQRYAEREQLGPWSAAGLTAAATVVDVLIPGPAELAALGKTQAFGHKNLNELGRVGETLKRTSSPLVEAAIDTAVRIPGVDRLLVGESAPSLRALDENVRNTSEGIDAYLAGDIEGAAEKFDAAEKAERKLRNQGSRKLVPETTENGVPVLDLEGKPKLKEVITDEGMAPRVMEAVDRMEGELTYKFVEEGGGARNEKDLRGALALADHDTAEATNRLSRAAKDRKLAPWSQDVSLSPAFRRQDAVTYDVRYGSASDLKAVHEARAAFEAQPLTRDELNIDVNAEVLKKTGSTVELKNALSDFDYTPWLSERAPVDKDARKIWRDEVDAALTAHIESKVGPVNERLHVTAVQEWVRAKNQILDNLESESRIGHLLQDVPTLLETAEKAVVYKRELRASAAALVSNTAKQTGGKVLSWSEAKRRDAETPRMKLGLKNIDTQPGKLDPITGIDNSIDPITGAPIKPGWLKHTVSFFNKYRIPREQRLSEGALRWLPRLTEIYGDRKTARINLALTDSFAKAWADHTGRPVRAWWDTRFADIRKGKEGDVARGLSQDGTATSSSSSGSAPYFYSGLERTIEEYIPASFTSKHGGKSAAAQAIDAIRRSPLYRAEEDKWTGLSEWLRSKENQEKIDPSEILGFVMEQTPKVEIKRFEGAVSQREHAANYVPTGTEPAGHRAAYREKLAEASAPIEIMDEFDALVADMDAARAFNAHRLDYTANQFASRRHHLEALITQWQLREARANPIVSSAHGPANWSTYHLPDGTDPFEILISPNQKETFNNPHFQGETGTVHIRGQKRVVKDAAGKDKTILELTEIQNDWAQSKKAQEDRTAILARYGITPEEYREIQRSSMMGTLTEAQLRKTRAMSDADYEALAKANNKFAAQSGDQDIDITLPEYPHKASSSWVELGLKTAIRKAAEDGIDEIRLVSGEDVRKIVGGEEGGQLEFYNEIIPNVMDGLGNRIGARVESAPSAKYINGLKKELEEASASTDPEKVKEAANLKRRIDKLEKRRAALGESQVTLTGRLDRPSEKIWHSPRDIQQQISDATPANAHKVAVSVRDQLTSNGWFSPEVSDALALWEDAVTTTDANYAAAGIKRYDAVDDAERIIASVIKTEAGKPTVRTNPLVIKLSPELMESVKRKGFPLFQMDDAAARRKALDELIERKYAQVADSHSDVTNRLNAALRQTFSAAPFDPERGKIIYQQDLLERLSEAGVTAEEEAAFGVVGMLPLTVPKDGSPAYYKEWHEYRWPLREWDTSIVNNPYVENTMEVHQPTRAPHNKYPFQTAYLNTPKRMTHPIRGSKVKNSEAAEQVFAEVFKIDRHLPAYNKKQVLPPDTYLLPTSALKKTDADVLREKTAVDAFKREHYAALRDRTSDAGEKHTVGYGEQERVELQQLEETAADPYKKPVLPVNAKIDYEDNPANFEFELTPVKNGEGEPGSPHYTDVTVVHKPTGRKFAWHTIDGAFSREKALDQLFNGDYGDGHGVTMVYLPGLTSVQTYKIEMLMLLKHAAEHTSGKFAVQVPDVATAQATANIFADYGAKSTIVQVSPKQQFVNVELPPEIIDVLHTRSPYLFQDTAQPKGLIEFTDDNRAIISLYEKADATTFVHELGHLLRSDLSPKDMDALVADMQGKGINVAHDRKGHFIPLSDEGKIDAEDAIATGRADDANNTDLEEIDSSAPPDGVEVTEATVSDRTTDDRTAHVQWPALVAEAEVTATRPIRPAASASEPTKAIGPRPVVAPVTAPVQPAPVVATKAPTPSAPVTVTAPGTSSVPSSAPSAPRVVDARIAKDPEVAQATRTVKTVADKLKTLDKEILKLSDTKGHRISDTAFNSLAKKRVKLVVELEELQAKRVEKESAAIVKLGEIDRKTAETKAENARKAAEVQAEKDKAAAEKAAGVAAKKTASLTAAEQAKQAKQDKIDARLAAEAESEAARVKREQEMIRPRPQLTLDVSQLMSNQEAIDTAVLIRDRKDLEARVQKAPALTKAKLEAELAALDVKLTPILPKYEVTKAKLAYDKARKAYSTLVDRANSLTRTGTKPTARVDLMSRIPLAELDLDVAERHLREVAGAAVQSVEVPAPAPLKKVSGKRPVQLAQGDDTGAPSLNGMHPEVRRAEEEYADMVTDAFAHGDARSPLSTRVEENISAYLRSLAGNIDATARDIGATPSPEIEALVRPFHEGTSTGPLRPEKVGADGEIEGTAPDGSQLNPLDEEFSADELKNVVGTRQLIDQRLRTLDDEEKNGSASHKDEIQSLKKRRRALLATEEYRAVMITELEKDLETLLEAGPQMSKRDMQMADKIRAKIKKLEKDEAKAAEPVRGTWANPATLPPKLHALAELMMPTAEKPPNLANVSDARAVPEDSVHGEVYSKTAGNPKLRGGVAAVLGIGDDEHLKERGLPPEARRVTMSLTRAVQETNHDVSRLVREWAQDPALRENAMAYLRGDTVKFGDGIDVPTSGVDHVDWAFQQLEARWQELSIDEQMAINDFAAACGRDESGHIDTFHGGLSNADVARSTAVLNRILDAADFVDDAPVPGEMFIALAKQSVWLADNSETSRPQQRAWLLTMLDAAGVLDSVPDSRTPRALAFNRPPVDRATQLVTAMGAYVPSVNAERQATVMLATYGGMREASSAALSQAFGISPKEASTYNRWRSGLAVSPEQVGQAESVARRFGLSTTFEVAPELDLGGALLPKETRARLAQELLHGRKLLTPEEKLAISYGAPVEDVVSGKHQASWPSVVMQRTVERIKSSMVFANLFMRGRGFINDAQGLFEASAAAGDLGPAARSVARRSAQLVVTNTPLLSQLGDTTQLVTKVVTGPANPPARLMNKVRYALANATDATIKALISLNSASRNDPRVTDILEGSNKVFDTPHGPMTAREIRAIFRQEGVYATYERGQMAEALYDTATEKSSRVMKGVHRVSDAVRRHRYESNYANSVQSRVGNALAFMEMGYDPRTGARMGMVTAYDYVNTSTGWDRWLTYNMFFPFQSFRKNNNRYHLNRMTSYDGVRKIAKVYRLVNGGPDTLAAFFEAWNAEDDVETDGTVSETGAPYGVYLDSLSPEEFERFSQFRLTWEEGHETMYGKDVAAWPPGVKAALAGSTGAFDSYWSNLGPEEREIVLHGYGGYANVPIEVKRYANEYFGGYKRTIVDGSMRENRNLGTSQSGRMSDYTEGVEGLRGKTVPQKYSDDNRFFYGYMLNRPHALVRPRPGPRVNKLMYERAQNQLGSSKTTASDSIPAYSLTMAESNIGAVANWYGSILALTAAGEHVAEYGLENAGKAGLRAVGAESLFEATDEDVKLWKAGITANGYDIEPSRSDELYDLHMLYEVNKPALLTVTDPDRAIFLGPIVQAVADNGRGVPVNPYLAKALEATGSAAFLRKETRGSQTYYTLTPRMQAAAQMTPMGPIFLETNAYLNTLTPELDMLTDSPSTVLSAEVLDARENGQTLTPAIVLAIAQSCGFAVSEVTPRSVMSAEIGDVNPNDK